ncbi:MAG: FimB/Mfa2 family fimbrial subunit [Bacteroides sp.]|nr:FimB/Mfa2 family fimbrial subunit [Bacteroides sp.]
MKTIKQIILALLGCWFVISCQQVPNDDEWLSEEEMKPLKVKVRSAENVEIAYPLYLYAFDKNGKLAASQTIVDEGKDMALSLTDDEYQVVALSGVTDDYQLPKDLTLEGEIKLSNIEGADAPLMVGRADVGGSRNEGTMAEIALSYVVAQLNVVLKNVPADVSTVQLSISPLYSSLSMGGEYGGDVQKVKVNCTLGEDGVWSAQPTYIFPGSAAETTFSVSFKKEDGTELTYGYTYQGKPEANHPFNITGSYAEGVIVGGSFEISGWEEAIDVEFTFGANVVPDKEGEDEEEPEIDMTNVPEVGTIWNDMIVVDIGEADENGVDLLLMSLDEWESDTLNVVDIPTGYSVNGISGWNLPTYDEATTIRARFSNDARLELNDIIKQYDSQLVGLSADSNDRYLCLKNGKYYSFSFAPKTNISPAKKRSYYVRLVKTYRVAI